MAYIYSDASGWFLDHYPHLRNESAKNAAEVVAILPQIGY
jgi:hypothetical protein